MASVVTAAVLFLVLGHCRAVIFICHAIAALHIFIYNGQQQVRQD
jgi:hypothetical protein